MDYIPERLNPSYVRANMTLKNYISNPERERQKKCSEYHKNIKHTYLKLDDIKSVDGSKMFLAIIDYEDSIHFREDHFFNKTLFPHSTILGNLGGFIYDFNEYFYLDLNKYKINYARSFSSMVDEHYWHFVYDGSKVTVKFNTVYSDKKNANGRGQVVMDKFHSIRLAMGLNSEVLYDEDAVSKVLLKRKEG